jgi:glutamate 5-kinase
MSARPPVSAAQRVVIKLGTRVLTHDDGTLALARLFGVVEAAAGLARAGREVLIVSSGAVGLGRDALGLAGQPLSLADRQACAAVGQSRLMGLYDAGFSRLGQVAAQVLLTQSDFDDRERYLNLRGTLAALLRRGVVPIINENDAVATEELAFIEGDGRPVFGDNDRLAALVATKLGADLLVLLTDVEGVYESDPRVDPAAALLSVVTGGERIAAGASGSGVGRGGMRSKVEAAAIAARAGCHAVIASGRRLGALGEVLAGADRGTWFPAGPGLAARQRWIAFAAAPRGVLRLDPGAVSALLGRGASLLAAGVSAVEGDFQRGDVVELRGPDGALVGRGIVHCGAADARLWAGGQPPDGARNHDALVHRDHMVLEKGALEKGALERAEGGR